MEKGSKINWSIKEENNPTETVFYIMNGSNVFGIITGQNHIEGDIEKARSRAKKVVKNKKESGE
jgi:hypothetical protein